MQSDSRRGRSGGKRSHQSEDAGPRFDPRDLLRHLENAAEALGIIVRYEKLGGDSDSPAARSGSCRLRSDRIILIDSGLSPTEKCRALAEELKRFDLSNIYIPPMVRRLIGDSKNDY